MTKYQMLCQIDYQTILTSMLGEERAEQVRAEVDRFFKRRHGLPVAVLNAILIKTIVYTGDSLFNEVYLRRVAETFKAEGIKTAATALEHIENAFEDTQKFTKNRVSEPDWVEGYIQDLAHMKG